VCWNIGSSIWPVKILWVPKYIDTLSRYIRSKTNDDHTPVSLDDDIITQELQEVAIEILEESPINHLCDHIKVNFRRMKACFCVVIYKLVI
jgi:hypothetical protein